MFSIKKIVLFVLLIGWVSACQSKKESTTGLTPPSNNKSLPPGNDPQEKLVLNGSSKWKADEVSTNNVNNLQTIIKSHTAGNDRSLPSYVSVAGELQTGLNKMVKECRMQGADHDALHHWLIPLIAQVKQLEHSGSVATAGTTFAAISHQVSRYYQYFE